MDISKTGQFIAHARKERKLTQQQLAEALNITGAAVSKWERGLSFPDVSLLEPLTTVLDISVIELLRGEHQTGSQISTEEAEQSVRDALHLLMADLEKNNVPVVVQKFFAPQYYQKAFALVLFFVGASLGITGGILALLENPEGVPLGVWGLSILIFAFALWIWYRLIVSRNKQTIRNGIKMMATATKIRQNHFTDMPFQKNTHPFIIKFKYVFEGKLYQGRSPMLWERPELTTKDIPIFVDPTHPRRYFMDMERFQ